MPNFKFNLSVSTTDSHSKPKDKDIAKLQYRKQSIDIETFIQYIREGHSFCYCFDDMDDVFGNGTKTLSNFRYTNVIAIDIDDSPLQMEDFVNNLSKKPTISYTTYSNKLKGYRYRIIYLFFDKIVGVENYKSTYNGILSANGMTIKDNCMESPNQFFIGNGSADVEIINNGCLYSQSDFAIKNNIV